MLLIVLESALYNNRMSEILLLSSFIGISFFLRFDKKIDLIIIPFYAFSIAIFILYVFGIFSFLLTGLYLVYAIGICLGLLAFFNHRKTHWNFKKIELRYLIFGLPFVILYWNISEEFRFTGWDEFSGWATWVKIIFESNSLLRSDSPVYYKEYPPAQQLFQYLFVKTFGWTEKRVLVAQGFFTFACILASVKFLAHQYLSRVFLFFTCLIFLYYFGFNYSNIYVDPLLGVYFSAVFLLSLKVRKCFLEYILLFICIAILVLIKEMGLLLALIVFAAYSITELFDNSFSEKNSSQLHLKIIRIIAFGLVIILAYKSWQLYLQSIELVRAHSIPPLSSFFNDGGVRISATLKEFVKRISYKRFHSIQISIISISITYAFLTFIAILIAKRSLSFKRLIFTGIILFFGFWAYTAFLLLTYLIFFGEYEGVRLASFERYMATFLLAWGIVAFGGIIGALEISNKPRAATRFSIAMLALALAFSPPSFREDITGINTRASLRDARYRVDFLTDIVKKYIKPGEKAYFINQNSTGFEKYIFNYTMLPFETLWWCWSLGSKYHSGDVWTCDQKLIDVIKGYEYLVIYNADAKFWNDNNALFDLKSYGKNSGVFRATHTLNSGLKFYEIQ